MNRLRQVLVASVLLVLALLPAVVHAAPPPTAPGKYKDWDGGTLDEVEIIQPFHLHDYSRVLVLPIDASGLQMPTDNTRRPVEKILADSTNHFADQLDSDLPNRMKVKAEPAPANAKLTGTPGVLFLRSKFTEMNPGSASARVFSQGFAGATHITMEGDFIDGSTGKTLVHFSHHNYHNRLAMAGLGRGLSRNARDRKYSAARREPWPMAGTMEDVRIFMGKFAR